ncbi:MAG: hypothetical protein VW397_00275 [Candidatus Margulisiibacteriota bacterium]
MKKIFLILFCFLSIYSFGFDQTSVIQMTLTDARSGLLNGNYAVELLLVDNATNKTYWTQNQTIFFKDGFTEFIIGPFENLNFLLKPRIQLKIEDSLIEFPIHPTLFSIQSHRSSQLNDTDAIYTKSGNVGLGTTDPSSKLTVNGNLSFLDSTNGIIFNNGKKISGPIWQNLESSLSELSNTVSTSQTAITDLTSSIQSLVASVNILQTQTGASPLVVNSSLDNMILKIDSNGTISPLTDFYFNDSNHYMLLSNNNSLISTELSDQFIVRDNQLFVATSNPLEIISTDLTLPLHGNGEIRYFNQDYYLFNSGVWERINSGDLDYLKLPSKTITSLVPGTSNTIFGKMVGPSLIFLNHK